MIRSSSYPAAAAALALALVGGCSENLTPVTGLEPFVPGQLEPLDCVPNLDGQLTSEELTVARDVPVRYLVNPSGSRRAVDLAGLVNAAGDRRWDWSATSEVDQVASVQAGDIGGKWYASEFPGADFVTPLDLDERLDGIYQLNEEGLFLLGLASVVSEPQAERTLLVYDAPVALFRLPLEVGKTWVATGVVSNGTLQGLPFAGRYIYNVEVSSSGQLSLPDLVFDQAYQVLTTLTVQPAVGESIITQQASYMFECFGEVARAVSAPGEEERIFGEAVELRRLGLLPSEAFTTE